MQTLKSISKFILYAGAIACCLAGLGASYLVIAAFKMILAEDQPYQLALWAIYLCLAFTPAFMFLRGLKTKAWHWVFIAITEAVVLALASFVLYALIDLAQNGFGE